MDISPKKSRIWTQEDIKEMRVKRITCIHCRKEVIVQPDDDQYTIVACTDCITHRGIFQKALKPSLHIASLCSGYPRGTSRSGRPLREEHNILYDFQMKGGKTLFDRPDPLIDLVKKSN